MSVVQLVMVSVMMCLTCLHCTVSAQTSTEGGAFISRGEVDKLIADVMRTARQETEQLRETLSDVIDRQNDVIDRLEADNEATKHDIKQQKAVNERLEAENDYMKEQIEGLELDNAVMKEQIDGLISAAPWHDEESTQVAFSVVSHNTFGPVETDTNIPYEVIHTNIGGGWTPVGNAFMATIDGVYMFTASIVSDPLSTADVQCHFIHSHEAEQTIVASMWAFGVGDHSSGDANSVIVELSQGDFVSIQLRYGDRILHSNSVQVHSTFSGFLLFT